MKEEYREIVNELLGLPEDAEIEFKGVTDTAVTNLMICKRLDRIAYALEDIGESLSALAACVCEVPMTSYAPGYTFFRIGGSVDTDTL